jgi:predicted RNA-binding protein with RPS1 domain
MDFKIAGTANGITAMQLDVKRPLPIEVLVRAMCVAKSGRRRILKTMQGKCQLHSYGIISKLKPRKHLKLSAPRVAIVRFDPLRKRDLIGPGGAVLRQMEDRFGISLDLTQEGQCLLYGQDAGLVAKARSAVMDLVADVEEGEIYEGTVIEIKDFGAIVELLRNKEGLLHVSELSDDISNSLRVDDSYGVAKEHLTVGQKIDVLCIGVDTVQGSIKLSRKRLQADTVQGSIKLSRKRLQAAADSLSTIPGGLADNQTNLAETLQANAVLTATNTTMSTQLAQIMQGMQLLQTQMAVRHTGDTPTNVQGSQSAPQVPWMYCWTHGKCKHSGAICKHKKEGHKDDATMENKMGGSTRNM